MLTPKAKRLRRAIPPWRGLVAGSLAWGLVIALCTIGAMWWRNRLMTPDLFSIFTLYFSGSAAGYMLAVPLARFLALGRGADTRFAACFLCLSVMTIGLTAAFFALQYRDFYAQWHDPFLSRIWIFQLIFTTAGAVYQFAVLGIPLYLPHGIVLLVAASLILARRMR